MYVIKVIRKDRLARERGVLNSLLIEYQVQFKCRHPFICEMNYFFQSKARFYFIMPLLSGGHLGLVLK